MFRLYDKARRRICIAAFFLLCLVPTAVVLAWCIVRHLPGHVASEARKLSRELGLDVSLDGLEHLRPGVARYEGLELADPETGGTVLRCGTLQAQWTETTDRQGESKDTLVLIASAAEVEAAAFDRLGQLLGRMLQGQAGRPDVELRLRAGSVTLRADENSHTLTELKGGIEPFQDGTQAWVSFRLAGIDAPKPVRIRILRNRQTAPPLTGFELDTGGGAVPCSLLAAGLPILEPLGLRSRFRGRLWTSQTSQTSAGRADDGWDGEITGELLDVDLGSLVSDRFPHKLVGMGQMMIQPARFRRGRLELASGALVVGPGEIGRSLIDAAVGQLRLVRGVQPNGPGDCVLYEQLALAFLIDSQGLRLQGRCSAGGPGAILIDRYNCLLGEPEVQPLPVAALVQTLVPAGDVQVPATRQTDRLMRRLPVPQIAAHTDIEPPLRKTRIGLGRGAGG